jgi:hypothetical protein
MSVSDRSNDDAKIAEWLETSDELASSHSRCPPHPQSLARKRTEEDKICLPEHPSGSNSMAPIGECRRCSLVDVTVADVDQDVETPNVHHLKERREVRGER